MKLRSSLILIFLLLGAVQGFTQTKEELQEKRDQIAKQISITNDLLKKTEKSRSKAQNQMNLIERKISLRQDLIDNLRGEIRIIDKRIDEQQTRIDELKRDLENLRDDYAELIRQAQRNQNSYDRMMYVFAADDFFQAIRRLRYMEEYARYRKSVAESLEKKQKQLTKKIEELKEEKQEKENLADETRSAQENLAKDKQSQSKNLADLKQEERSLKQKLQKQKEERERLSAAIQKIIEEEIRLAREKSGTSTFELTPEAQALSEDFESNRGKLPWPVERGVLTGKFGEHPHPVLAGIKVTNNGVDIATDKSEPVRAVFEGKVTSIFSIPGAGQNVIISHGAYRMVYANLSKVFVDKGQSVSVKDPIGQILTDGNEQKAEAHLEIWKITNDGTVKQNPEVWLYQP